jgi:hypothetical protein
MSGSGGGGGGTPHDDRPVDCENLSIPTVLNSPVAKVVATLKKGDRLVVVQNKSAGYSRLEAEAPNGKVAGSLTPDELLDIVDCMNRGHKYVAIVTSEPEGAVVKVRIQSAKK